jgi:hypothetical protein
MKKNDAADTLRGLADALRQWCAAARVPCIDGVVSDAGTLPQVSLALDGSDDFSAVTHAIEQLGARAVFVGAVVLGDAQWEDRLADVRGRPRSPEREHLLGTVRASRSRVGQVGVLSVEVLTKEPSLIVLASWSAPWFEEAFVDFIEDDDDLDDEDDEAPLRTPRH